VNEQDRQEHTSVFDAAMRVYEERDAVRQGLWKDYRPEDQLIQAKIKIERCLQALKLRRPLDVIHEVPDILNYTIFAARQCAEQVEIREAMAEAAEDVGRALRQEDV
jgi:hypothetical protein